jgi:hypothetical protein
MERPSLSEVVTASFVIQETFGLLISSVFEGAAESFSIPLSRWFRAVVISHKNN